MKRNRGFPFEEEDGGAWSELAARHPDIAARLRPAQQPPPAPPRAPHPQQAFPRKRRPEHGDQQQDFGANFDGFERFPFDNIPAEFRGHLPPQWGRRYEQSQHPQPPHPQYAQQQYTQQPQGGQAPVPQKQTIATQTEPVPEPIPLPNVEHPVHPNSNQPQQQQQQPVPQPIPLPHLPQRKTSECEHTGGPWSEPPSEERGQRCVSAPPEPNMSQEPGHDGGNVRIIPIQVESRDGPGGRSGSPAPPPPFEEPQPAPQFHHPHPGFAPPPPFRAGFNTNPRPYTSQKAYPQQTFARGVSPQRSHSPNPQHQEYVQIPVQHETKTEHRPQQRPPPQQQQPPFQQQQQQYQQQQKFQEQHRAQTPPPQPKPQPPQNDPITQILAIQTDVLKLMTEVENFTGSKKDKQYVYLDEMLTRNLIKLDDIETEGKENIRAARKEAIRCIQKCIAVLEAKAEKASQSQSQPLDVDMNSQDANPENGEDMKPSEGAPVEAKEGNEGAAPTVADTRPADNPEAKPDENAEKEKKGKKKNIKKRDKSKDNKSTSKEGKDSMQIDGKGDKAESPAQAMDVDGAASQ